MEQQNSLLPVGALFKQSFRFYHDHWRLFLSIAALPFAVDLLVQVLIHFPNTTGLILGGFLGLVSLIVTLFFQVAILYALVNVSGITADQAYIQGKKFLWSYICLAILASLVALGGYVLLIIPGIILSVSLSQSTFLLFKENKKGMDAIAESWALVKDRWWQVFLRLLVLGLVVGLIFIAVSLFFPSAPGVDWSNFNSGQPSFAYAITQSAVSYLAQIFALVYTYQLFLALRSSKTEASVQDLVGHKKKAKIFIVIGIVGLIVIIASLGLILAWVATHNVLPVPMD